MHVLAGVVVLLLPLLALRIAALLVSLTRRQRATLQGVRL